MEEPGVVGTPEVQGIHDPSPARRRARRSFLGLIGGGAAAALVSSRAEAQTDGDEFVTRTPATSERNVIQQSDGVVPLTVDGLGAQSHAGLARFLGGERGNGTRYASQVGIPGYTPVPIITNGWITVNGAANDPFGVSSVVLANGAASSYMLGIASDIGSNPVVVIEGGAGNTPGPLLRGYRYRSSRVVVEIGARGTIDLTPDRNDVTPITIRPATGGQTVNLIEWRAQDGTPRSAINKDGLLDVGGVNSAAVGGGRAVGDKIMLYGDQYGLGVQGGRLVAYVSGGAKFAVRRAAGSGHKSSGPDAVTLGADGDLASLVAGKGLIVTSPDGQATRRIGIDNSGALTATPLGAS